MQPPHVAGEYRPDGQSDQSWSSAHKESKDSEENVLYVQFCDTLQSFEALIDLFEKMPPKVQRELQEKYPILETSGEADRQYLRTRLQAMIQNLEELAAFVAQQIA
jgi:hypothetical protein